MNFRDALLVVLFFCASSVLSAEEIRVSLQLQPNQRDTFERIFQQFQVETGIKVVSVVETDLGYKRKVPVWLIEGKDTPDVMFWSASQRLYLYAEKGLILPITELWDEQNYDELFPHFKTGVTLNGEVYAIPFAYYHWGLFFRQSMVEQFGGAPEDWESFISVLTRMKEAGITPIGIGTRQNWPAAAWFDYINLRMNGLDFHLELLNGSVSFHDARVQKVLSEWKRLIDSHFYNEDHENYDWDGVLPFFYRNKMGFMLLGNFVASRWPVRDPLFEDIGFMPFPTINRGIPYYENAPTDVFMIPKSTTKVAEAKAFLRFMARADVQTTLNKDLGYLPPNREATVGEDRFIRAGAELISRAAGLAQYFDRDTPPAFDELATPLLADYVSTGNIDALTEGLEAARITIFGLTPNPQDSQPVP